MLLFNYLDTLPKFYLAFYFYILYILWLWHVSDIPYTAALTKVDTICEGVNDDIRDVFKSKAVAKAAQNLKELLNLDMKYILPIQVKFHAITYT